MAHEIAAFIGVSALPAYEKNFACPADMLVAASFVSCKVIVRDLKYQHLSVSFAPSEKYCERHDTRWLKRGLPIVRLGPARHRSLEEFISQS